MKLKVGILFGGRSAEHEVSVCSARNIFKGLDRERFEPFLIGLARDGTWNLVDPERFLVSESLSSCIEKSSAKRKLTVTPQCGRLAVSASEFSVELDLVFPIVHGPFGEDGTLQGMLKLLGVPFVGPGVLGSSLCMDKDASKRALRDAGVPVVPWHTVYDSTPSDPEIEQIASRLKYPLFVKPSNMGSSVGVNKASDRHALRSAIVEALRFDRAVLVEQFVPAREIECAVLGNLDPKPSVLGEIVTGPQHEFYSYSAKYVDNDGQVLAIPASIPPLLSDQIRQVAVDAFKALHCEGMARVDFFLEKGSDRFYVNEINTLPGFTDISMYPKLWEATGISYSHLISRLLDLAMERTVREGALKISPE